MDVFVSSRKRISNDSAADLLSCLYYFHHSPFFPSRYSSRSFVAPNESLSTVFTFSRWFGPGRIGREFRPRHAVLTLHVWLLHKRLLVDSYDQSAALKVDEELFSILWDDTTCRIRQTGVMELAVNKNLMQVQQYTFLHLTHYDHVYTQFLDQPAERLKELRNLVWHHWLLRDPDGEKRTDHLDRICWYIDANYRNILHEWPDEYYRSSRVAWVDLPDFTNIRKADHNHHTNEDDKADDDDDGGSSGSLFLPERPLHPDDVLPHPWLRNITNRGVEYYWNPNTGESTWERPTQ